MDSRCGRRRKGGCRSRLEYGRNVRDRDDEFARHGTFCRYPHGDALGPRTRHDVLVEDRCRRKRRRRGGIGCRFLHDEGRAGSGHGNGHGGRRDGIFLGRARDGRDGKHARDIRIGFLRHGRRNMDGTSARVGFRSADLLRYGAKPRRWRGLPVVCPGNGDLGGRARPFRADGCRVVHDALQRRYVCRRGGAERDGSVFDASDRCARHRHGTCARDGRRDDSRSAGAVPDFASNRRHERDFRHRR